ncbi:hypothetical protein B0J14DRAFT_472102 [Halenospora varia]|nr:hypothetical protein B0J14DRAFT_472102 [Halenospora varia]
MEESIGPYGSASRSKDEKVVSLINWCADVLMNSATKAFFGDCIYDVAPDIVKDIVAYDEDSWKFIYKYPYFAAKEVYDARNKCGEAFADYLLIRMQQHADAAWIVGAMERGQQDIGIADQKELVATFFQLYRL